jgi:hypothetical protein
MWIGLRALIEYQIAGGVRLLVPCGTTGESATMSDEEDQLVIKTTVEVAHGRPRSSPEPAATQRRLQFSIHRPRASLS